MRHLQLALLCLIFLAAAPARAATDVVSVPELDIGRYAGQWHEIARLPMSFQNKCVGDVTASYTLRSDGLVGVHNACRVAGGGIESAEGRARRIPGKPGQLEVSFVPQWLTWLPLVWADYWVIALDPDYQWAVVGDPKRKYLWILSRSPSMDRALFGQLRQRAEAMGYDLDALIVSAPVQ
ncbi:lipocalin family protein [Stenotrophomonas sp. MMGLT7]|uniref:lipocalin family protein n=1 Tax=Stenotrophomonas sp. MMGLT7 TaxID=2901227 RepID=UPI001E29063B|nr:lipocalin family protein [Stenotrophomonas sp. MMGLT7]MCD7097174.1 lipocalin family protein [Stenotrophomonas sp. MMGLT7]